MITASAPLRAGVEAPTLHKCFIAPSASYFDSWLFLSIDWRHGFSIAGRRVSFHAHRATVSSPTAARQTPSTLCRHPDEAPFFAPMNSHHSGRRIQTTPSWPEQGTAIYTLSYPSYNHRHRLTAPSEISLKNGRYVHHTGIFMI